MTADEAVLLVPGPTFLVAGSGAQSVAMAAARAGYGADVVIESLLPSAVDLVEVSAKLQALDDINPVYIRPPDAKPPTDQSLARMP